MFENLIMMPYSSIKVSINLLKTKDIKINELYINKIEVNACM